MSNKDALDNFKAELKTAVADAVDAKVAADGGVKSGNYESTAGHIDR